jgi:hypothetical protein
VWRGEEVFGREADTRDLLRVRERVVAEQHPADASELGVVGQSVEGLEPLDGDVAGPEALAPFVSRRRPWPRLQQVFALGEPVQRCECDEDLRAQVVDGGGVDESAEEEVPLVAQPAAQHLGFVDDR